jgi:sugar phosphate isomerase/epimerase
MTKLGVITDGISRDFERALTVMTEAGLEYAELQFLWDKEVGDLNDQEMAKAQALVKQFQVKVSCISRHNFVGIVMAKEFDCPLVRIMSFRRDMILFGKGGAEHWVVAKGAWDKLKQLLTPPVELAEQEGITLVLETGNNAMVPSAYLGRKLVDEMGSDRLKILWDPGNSLYANELPFPDGYDALKGGSLGHFHIKDAIVDMPKATVEFCEMGTGQMAPTFEPIANGLKADGYDGVISLESVYRPEGGSFEDGFKASVGLFKKVFA